MPRNALPGSSQRMNASMVAFGPVRLRSGGDQVGDEVGVRPHGREFYCPPHRLGYRDQLDAAGFVGVQYLAVQRLF